MMKRYAAIVAGAVLTLGACTSSGEEPPPAPEKTTVKQAPKPADPPKPKPAEPVEKPAPAPPTDNCGLDPADMDYKTKVQCGLIEEAPEPETPDEGTTPEPGTPEFSELCQQGILTSLDGCSNADTPGDDSAGSLYTNPGQECAPGMTLVPESPIGPYCDGGGPAVPEDTDPYPGAETDGDTGRTQYEYGCEQGWIPAEQC